MGILDFFRRLLGGTVDEPGGGRRGIDDLARRLDIAAEDLRAIRPRYRSFRRPKRTGGSRRIDAPEPVLKALQRRVLRRLLGRLAAHPAAHGFERGRSIVTNALSHAGKAVVVRMDFRDFFASTPERKVVEFFLRVGWDRESSRLLGRICTFRGALPQGAPTSPRLANLVNRRLDARLDALARKCGAAYTRYADDLTFSFAADDRRAVHGVIRGAKAIATEEGYRIHQERKLRIRRRGDRQTVTGLTVNDGVRLPRKTRRWLRAVKHSRATGREATLTDSQLAGWQSLQRMVEVQAGRPADRESHRSTGGPEPPPLAGPAPA